jgi:hypothetical protein
MWLHNLFSRKQFRKGDILYINRGFYKHYGIYVGDDSVIHYAKKESLFSPIMVQESSLMDFAKDYPISVDLQSRKRGLSPRETVKRAISQLGKAEYNLLLNNCEHFARWCKNGQSKSEQVKDVCSLFNMDQEPLEIIQDIKASGVQAFIMYIDQAFEDLTDGFSDWLDSIN